MRIRHKLNHGWAPNRVDPDWANRVEREATAQTDATERAWHAAHRRLEKAQQRRARLASLPTVTPSRLAVADFLIEQRRQELLALERLMTSHAAPSRARGRKSFRPVPYADRSL